MRFIALTSSIIAAFSLLVAATPTPEGNLVTIEQFKDWLVNTRSEVTFIGKPLGDLSDLSKRNALNTVVTLCTNRVGNVCEGPCIVYNGGSRCVNAPGTACLSATSNIDYCDLPFCDGNCSQYFAVANDCGSNGPRLENNFCATPGTFSVRVP